MPIIGKTPKDDLREGFVLFDRWRSRTEPPRPRCFLVSWFLCLRFSVISVMNFMNAKCREIFFSYFQHYFLAFLFIVIFTVHVINGAEILYESKSKKTTTAAALMLLVSSSKEAEALVELVLEEETFGSFSSFSTMIEASVSTSSALKAEAQ